MERQTVIERRIKYLVVFFITALAASGLTAIPLMWEVDLLESFFTGVGAPITNIFPEMSYWIARVTTGIRETMRLYPFMAYGTDWLAFGHIGLAIMFIGPLRDPVRNIWVIEAGMVLCVLLIPWALIFGPMRGIPFFWTLVDMSFGVIGIIPLWYARKIVLELAE